MTSEKEIEMMPDGVSNVSDYELDDCGQIRGVRSGRI